MLWQGLYWTLPRDRVEEIYEDEQEDENDKALAEKEASPVETAKDKDDEAPPPLERGPTLVQPYVSRMKETHTEYHYTLRRDITASYMCKRFESVCTHCSLSRDCLPYCVPLPLSRMCDS